MELDSLKTFQVAACDLNGQMRGKIVPGSYASKLDGDAVRAPLSVLSVDLWGADVENSPLVFESGDADGILRPTQRGPVPLPWCEHPTALVPMSLYTEDGAPFGGDPRHALVSILDRYKARGWQVIAATEMEFTLVNDTGDTLSPPRHPQNGRPLDGAEILSMAQMEAFSAFFSDLYAGAEDMGIPAQTAISEAGIGQFEVTLQHQDALQAADNAWLFKSLVRGLARKHDMAATFMAKPYAVDASNGMHVHFSVLDAQGQNVFDNAGPEGTETLQNAIAGCLAAMPACSLIFAPHGNSYARFVENAHVPVAATWGYENRTVAVRIPGGAPVARRIEHRTAGGDINPYLLLSAVLGAALLGVEDALKPPPPIAGNAYGQDVPRLALDWAAAIAIFETDPIIKHLFDPILIDTFARMKRQEVKRFADLDPSLHWRAWLERV